MTEKPKGTKKLATSAKTEAHVEALAKKIQEDPSFPLLHETARKMSEKYSKDKGQA